MRPRHATISKHEPSTTGRRRFLRSAGVAVGGASIGIPGVAVGRQNTDKATGRDVKRVLSKEQVQSLLDELGNPPLKRGKAEVSTTSFGQNKVSVTVIPTQVGSLAYFQSDNGIKQAFFFFVHRRRTGKFRPDS